MKQLLSLLFVGLFTGFSVGQQSQSTAFDIADFSAKMETAEWLCQYDMVAWWTSDSVMTQDKKELERLGKEWFCFEQNDTWHAVYGKYENNTFDLVFHFEVDTKGNVSRTSNAVDTTVLHGYSRALQTANNQIAALKDSVSLMFNQYIKQNDDKTYSVWILPAFQPNSVAVYGGEFIYTIDATGTKVLKDESYYQGAFRGFKIDETAEIWLQYPEKDKPTLGSVFFVWYYKSYFAKIVIDNTNSISTTVKSGKEWTWIHGEKTPEKKKKKKK